MYTLKWQLLPNYFGPLFGEKPLEWVYEPHKQPGSVFIFQIKLYKLCVMNIPVLCHLIPATGTGISLNSTVSRESSFHCDSLPNPWGERIFSLVHTLKGSGNGEKLYVISY